MKVLARYGAGYVLDCFRERVTADDFRGEGITRVLVVPGLGDRAVAAMRRMFKRLSRLSSSAVNRESNWSVTGQSLNDCASRHKPLGMTCTIGRRNKRL